MRSTASVVCCASGSEMPVIRRVRTGERCTLLGAELSGKMAMETDRFDEYAGSTTAGPGSGAADARSRVSHRYIFGAGPDAQTKLVDIGLRSAYSYIVSSRRRAMGR